MRAYNIADRKTDKFGRFMRKAPFMYYVNPPQLFDMDMSADDRSGKALHILVLACRTNSSIGGSSISGSSSSSNSSSSLIKMFNKKLVVVVVVVVLIVIIEVARSRSSNGSSGIRSCNISIEL